MEEKIEILDEDKKVLNEEFKDVMPPKKKSPIGLIILIIILMCGCLVGGYFINEKGLIKLGSEKETKEEKKKETKKEETKKEEVKEEELDVKSEQVTGLFETITTANTYYCGYFGVFKSSKITPNDISSEDRSAIMLHYVYSKYGYTEGKTYTKDEIEKVYKQIFGKDVSVQHGSARGCPSLSYDSSKEIYTVGPSACGGTCGPFRDYGEIVKAVKKGDNITLDVKVLFANSDLQKFFTDYEGTKEVEVPVDNNESITPIVIEKGTLYKVTFKLEDGNYVFVSSEPVK